MVTLHKLSDFISHPISEISPSYFYQGRSPGGELLRLPRTCEAEAIARVLMQHLATDERYSREGKMYGILLVLDNGEKKILKAFSGLLNGCSVVDGWVPPIPGSEIVVLEETRTLAQLETINNQLVQLQQLPQRQKYHTIASEFEMQLQALSDRHRLSKQQRDVQRQIYSEILVGETRTIALEQLDAASRQQGIERKLLKRQRDEALAPYKQLIAKADIQMRELKQRRKELSRQLQTQMHAAYSLINFLGQSQTLQQIMPQGLPTGTGDCCAPKLLHYAATHNLKPLAMAEFWWGSNRDKIQGEFYGACAQRCQPLMGFLLSGVKVTDTLKGAAITTKPVKTGLTDSPLSILYEDEDLIAVNKPPGLLSVPGRYFHNQDSVLGRLRNLLPDGDELTAVHRLDMDTSGILLMARNLETYRQISQQFEQRQIHKVYEAVLCGFINTDKGTIELPLWGNPENRPYQEVNWQHGKFSVTKFKVICREGHYTRIEFYPLTGRTHQLRIHAADARGLGVAILGDRLYGNTLTTRLHLHARELSFEHPQLGKMHLLAQTPF